jgi:DNA-binding NarL/FixJ family response regulator
MSSAAVSSSPRAVCITANASLRKTLRRTLNAAGSSVEFVDDAPGSEPMESMASGATLLVVDQERRRAALIPTVMQVIGEDGHIMILGESIEDDEVVQLLRHASLNHIISDAENPDDTELVVTSVKLSSGDIFGLEKYLSWGAKLHASNIHTYEQKRQALATVSQHAKEVGARRQVIAKIESVTDELLMNALYDAPSTRSGKTRAERIRNAEDGIPSEESAVLRYACDGRYFAVSVQDDFGALRKDVILDNLVRARREKGRPQTGEESSGAGLGLYFILSSVTRFIANIDPGKRTEVVCLFDLKQNGRESEACARSLHIFQGGAAR